MSSYNLDKYEYLTGEELGLKPSTVEQAKFEYSPLSKIFNKGLDEEDKKEGILKRLKNIEKNKNKNNDNNKSELSSVRSESSKKTSISSDDKSQISPEYLKDNREEFFDGYPYIFDSDLKEFFNHIAFQEEKYIDYNLLLEDILLPSGDVLNFFNKYHDLYSFWIDAILKYSNINHIKSQRVNFLRDLMNGFSVYKNISKPKKKLNHEAKDVYLTLLRNPNKTVNDILISPPGDKDNKEIYSQTKMLFDLIERIFEKLVSKKVIDTDSDQSSIDNYEENIAEGAKLRKQRLDEIKQKEQNIHNYLFKEYFTNYQSPSDIYNKLSDAKKTEEHNIWINLTKSTLINLKKDIGNASKDDVNKTDEMNKIAKIVELILDFNERNQEGQGLKILTPSQMLSRLPISLVQLKAGNNSEKLKNEIRQLLYSLYRSKKLTTNIYKSLIDII